MGRIQSSVGLITGTDIVGTVDQLIAISAQPRDRLVASTELLANKQAAIAELTASVIGVQLAGNRLSSSTLFKSKTSTSSNSDALSVKSGSAAQVGTHVVRTLQTASTHNTTSLQRFSASDTALGFTGQISINHGESLIDDSVALSSLNNGRGVEPGVVRITDRSGKSAEIDFSGARDMDDVISLINDADINVRATTSGNSLQLIDNTGSTDSNLIVEQLGDAETAADLGIWGVDVASSTVTGLELDLPDGTESVRGAALSELAGGSGVGPLTNLDITLSDGSSASIDLSSATTTSEVIDAISASGLKLTVRLNDARNGFQVRDVSGGTGNFTIDAADDTASQLGLTASTTDDIVVGENLNRQNVTRDTLLEDLNGGLGVNIGSFTIKDSKGVLGAINLKTAGAKNVGELIDKINALSADVTASISENGDGISIVDNAGGSGKLTIANSGTATTASDLKIAGTATNQTIGGQTKSAIVGTSADVIEVTADDTLESLVSKINTDGRYGTASIQTNDDGSFSLRIRSQRGGEAGKLAINTTGFSLDLRTESRGADALIAVSTDGGTERYVSSSDGVFDLGTDGEQSSQINGSTPLASLKGGKGISLGSFKVTDSLGKTSAVNLRVEGITTVGQLTAAINNLGIGVTASINADGTGISVVDTAGGSETLTIEDVGIGRSASDLGIAGEATTQTIAGQSVSALVGPADDDVTDSATGISLTLKELSTDPITITVKDDPTVVSNATKTFVDQYNKLIEKLDSLTYFNAEAQEVGLLFGSSEANRIRDSYSRLLSGTITQAGDLKSLGSVGIRFNGEGKLEFDAEKFSDAMSDDSAAVEAFFTTSETGLSDRLDSVADRIAGVSNSLLIGRTETLGAQITQNNARIEALNDRLDNERERLLKQFYATEEAIGKIQGNSSYLSQIERITIPT